MAISAKLAFEEIFHMSCMEYVRSTPCAEEFVEALKGSNLTDEQLFDAFVEHPTGYDEFREVLARQTFAKSRRFKGLREYAENLYRRPGRIHREVIAEMAFERIKRVW